MQPALFEKFLNILKERQFKTLFLSDVIDWLQGKRTLPKRSVVLTFDDGYENVYYRAYPLLQRFEFKATLFLTTGYCNKYNDWPTQIANVPRISLLTWKQIKEMSQSIFSIQAHTCTHPVLTKLSQNRAKEELIHSKSSIEDRLGKRVGYFAYPYGKYNKRVYEMVSQHFDAACSTKLNFANLKSNRYLLERIDMYYFSGIFSSQLFMTQCFKPYLLLRQFIQISRLRLK